MKRRNGDAVLSQRVPGGVMHEMPADLRTALIANTTALAAWQDSTPLARNEFICWVLDAKQTSTRERRIRRTQDGLEDGQRRPCCWPGCKHRDRNGKQRAGHVQQRGARRPIAFELRLAASKAAALGIVSWADGARCG